MGLEHRKGLGKALGATWKAGLESKGDFSKNLSLHSGSEWGGGFRGPQMTGLQVYCLRYLPLPSASHILQSLPSRPPFLLTFSAFSSPSVSLLLPAPLLSSHLHVLTSLEVQAVLPERWGAATELCAVCGGSWAGQRQFGPETPVELSLSVGFFCGLSSHPIKRGRVPLPVSGDHHLVIVSLRRLDGREQSGGHTSMCD